MLAPPTPRRRADARRHADATLAAISAALGDAAFQARLVELVVEVLPTPERNTEAARQFVASETAKWAKLIAEAGIRAE